MAAPATATLIIVARSSDSLNERCFVLAHNPSQPTPLFFPTVPVADLDHPDGKTLGAVGIARSADMVDLVALAKFLGLESDTLNSATYIGAGDGKGGPLKVFLWEKKVGRPALESLKAKLRGGNAGLVSRNADEMLKLKGENEKIRAVWTLYTQLNKELDLRQVRP